MTMGEYTIKLDVENNNFEHVYLLDNNTGNVTNMLVDDYTFIATTNDNPDRFVMKLYDVNSIDEVENNGCYIYINNGRMIINGIKGKAMIDVYDIVGRCVVKLESSNNEERLSVPAEMFKTGVYVVRIADDNGVKAQKVIFE